MEATALTRVLAFLPDEDPLYLEGLRATIREVISYGLASVETEEASLLPIPPLLLSQTRFAARCAIPLDTVLRKFLACFALLSDSIFAEAAACKVRASTLHLLLSEQISHLDRLLGVVASEYANEEDKIRSVTSDKNLVERLRGLLNGDLIDFSKVSYDLSGWHIGAIGIGEKAEAALREVASRSSYRVLIARPRTDLLWSWIGSAEEVDCDELKHSLEGFAPEVGPLAIGEPAVGLKGWRHTHRQARVALTIAQREARVVRYGEVALLASLLKDDLLLASLRERYLKPLEEDRDGGQTSRRTLQAYFASGRNASSAAAALGVSRRTVGSRIRAIEKKLCCRLDVASIEIEAALLLGDIPGINVAGPLSERRTGNVK